YSRVRKRNCSKPSGWRCLRRVGSAHLFAIHLCARNGITCLFALVGSAHPTKTKAFPRCEGGVTGNRVERKVPDFEREERAEVEDHTEDQRDGTRSLEHR